MTGSEPCLFEGESYNVGDSWKIDRCTTCECVESEGEVISLNQLTALYLKYSHNNFAVSDLIVSLVEKR